MLRRSNLKGLIVPGTQERLIANLFADDTTTFLAEEDPLTDLIEILDCWCLAAGAQFNAEKNKIIPMGSKTFREKLIQEQRAKEEHEKIPERIQIAKDGESNMDIRSMAWE